MKKTGIFILTTILLILFSFSVVSATNNGNYSPQIMGDVNGDDTVSVADAVVVQRILVHSVTPTEDMKQKAMVMHRGDICLADVVCILRYVSGISCNGDIGTEIPSPTEPNTNPRFVVETVNANPGDKNVAVKIFVENNPGLASIALDVHYDDKNLTLTDFTYNSEAVSGSATVPFHAGTFPPCISVVNGTANITGDWNFVTLYFDVSDTADGVYDISVSYDEDNVYNIDENNVAMEVVKGAIQIGNSTPSTPTTYTVTFKNYDGSILAEQTVVKGHSAVAPAVPERSGYTFKGWDIPFDNITENLTVQALFEKESTQPQFVVSHVSAKSGDKAVAVTVSLKNNPGIASVSLDILYDKNALTLTDFQYNTELTQGSSTVPYNSSVTLPCLSVVNGTTNISGNGTLATLYFDVSDSAKGSFPITLQYDEDNVYDIDETNVAFDVVNGDITVQ